MNTRFLAKTGFAVALSVLPFVASCTQENANEGLSAAAAAPAVATTNSSEAPAPLEATPPSDPETAAAPVVAAPVPGAGTNLPPNIRPDSPLAEVVKLSQAGVDESVIASYVNNSTGTFNLSSDEIIYLNDIGVSSTLANAMIQRDQTLKQQSVTVAQTQAAQAAAPTQATASAAPAENTPPPDAPPPPDTVDVAPSVEPQPVVVNDTYFNDALAPYGTWIEVEGYGRCWQPTVVVANHGWAPYCDNGHWVYSDAGWYWYSNYSWGWATFHYGRWFNHPRWGWCWWPDRVWAPSWVTWRYSDDYCGWAPLPPRAYYSSGFGFRYRGHSIGTSFDFGLGANVFTFVSWGHFCDTRPYQHRVPAQQVTQVFNHTTIVNNYIVGSHNTIINRGIPPDRVSRHTHTEIRPVVIREVGSVAGADRRGERFDHDSRTIIVHRPNTPPNGTPRTGTAAAPANTPATTVSAGRVNDTARSHEHDRNADNAREREPRATTSPVTVVGAPARNPSTPPLATANQDATRILPRGRDARDENTSRTVRPQAPTPATSSSIVTSPSGAPPSPATPPARSPSRNPVIVVGRPLPNSTTGRNADNEQRAPAAQNEAAASRAQSTRVWPPTTAPTSSTPQTSAPQTPTRPSFTYRRPENEAPQISAPAYTAPLQTTPPPSYTAPVAAPPRSSSPAPTYNAPSYSAPRSTPAPAYSPPAPHSESRPAPSQSAPAPQTQSRSESRSNNSDSNQGGGRNRQPN